MKRLAYRPQFKPLSYVVALDIETSSRGHLLDIGCYTADDYKVFEGWPECFSFFYDLIELKECNIRVIAHNGFGFDFVNMIPWMLDHMDEIGLEASDLNIFSSESMLVGATINLGKYAIELFDTVRLFPGQSLEALARDFLGEGKVDIPEEYKSKMEVYKKKYPGKYYRYLKRDCESLYHIYCKFRDEVNEIQPIGELGYSSGSVAFRSFRAWLGKSKPKTFIYALPQEYEHFGEEAMRGGFTSFIGDGVSDGSNFYRGVNSYDVISMYPHAMMYVPVPIAEPRLTKKLLLTDDGDVWPGYYLCAYTQTKGRVPLFKPLKEGKHDEPQWSGNACLSHEEIQWLRENGSVEVFEGIYYPEYEQPFRVFIDRMMTAKQDAKAAGEAAKSWAYKILANSLYGKFAQRPMKQIIAITGNHDWYRKAIQAGRQFIEYHNGKCILYGTELLSSSFSNRLIGAMVTARSRLKLGLVMNTVHTIYGDTDSIYTQDELDALFIGDQVGQFEKKSKEPKAMVCLGKKLYTYGTDKHAKGVPNRSIQLEDFLAMAEGETVEIFYRTPTAFKTALKNKVEYPNEFIEKSRKLRKFPSMMDKGLIHAGKKPLKPKAVNDFLQRYHLI